MADPTSVVTQDFKSDISRHEYIIKNAEALVPGGIAALNRSLGHVEFMDDADDLIPAGVIVGQAAGDNDNLTGNAAGDYSAVVRGDIILKNITVTGASAVTDAGKLVYMSDGQTYTLTQPATGLPVGIVVRWISSTTCDVYMFDLKTSIIMSISGGWGGKAIKDFGTFPTNALQGTAAADLYSETSLEHYEIVSFHAQCVAHDNAAVAGSQLLNLEIDGTDVTEGVLTLAYTNCDAVGDMGTEINATAITAANEVHMGDVLQIEMAASGTGFTADVAAAFKLYAIINRLPGA